MAQSKIWVFCEHDQGQLAEVGLELLGKALELAHPTARKVAAVVMGHQLDPCCETLAKFGADEILVADHPVLRTYCNQPYAKVLQDAIGKYHPEGFLLGATAMGTDLAARLAARLRTGLSAHCIGLELSSEGQLRAVVPGWGGNVLATILCPRTQPQMVTVMPGVFEIPKENVSHSQIIPLRVDVHPEDVTYRVVDIRREEVRESSIEKAEVIIAGGWGMGSKQDWQSLEELASVLNGAVGATRPPVDEGWAKDHQMIGQSGRTVHPKLYIGIALSGQMHHMVGIKDAEVVVAINQDPKAPIFEQCDLGLVGDFKEIIPHLIKAIQGYKVA